MKLSWLLIWMFAGALGSFASSGNMTPAERGMAQARQAIEKNPAEPDGYNALAIALSRRARESSAVEYYTQAEDAIRKSLEVAPGNFGALKARVWILLGKHEFAKAREVARELNKRKPDDLLVYGFLTDANAELGNYDEAETACNWMLKLRPGNVPALTRAAYLRELFGDLAGAQELMQKAYQSTALSETEDRAWILTQIGHLNLVAGRIEDAEKVLQQALALFPDYHYALGTLAKVRIAQKNYDQAAGLLRQRYESARHAENLYDLAEALDLAGRNSEAREAYREFEGKALAESSQADNSNRELILYYTGYAHQPAKALETAEREYSRRHDVYTRDAYAWALHAAGRETDAREQLSMALAIGVRDPMVLSHAREIGMGLQP